MATNTIIAATTGAVATQVPFNMTNYVEPALIVASGLAGAEEIVPFVGGPNGWTPLYDSAGVQIKLTATKPQLSLAGGAHYGFTKTATAGAAALAAAVTV